MIPAGLAVGSFWRREKRNGARRVTGILGAGAALMAGWCLMQAAPVRAQAGPKAEIEGTWQGTLHVPQKDLRIVLKVTKTDAGALQAVNYSIDQGGQPLPVSSITFHDGELKFAVMVIDGTYDGKMSADGKSIAGEWKQGPNPLALVFERATPETAWTIPEPPKRIPPMAADADPSFEVVTIKPSKPDAPGKAITLQGVRLKTINTTVADLIKFAYDVQDKQIVGAPAWIETDKFDIDAQPDIPGAPDKDQMGKMIQKMLADRYQLKFHRESKELSAYVLTVAKSGPKMTKSEPDAGNSPGLFFRQLGVLTVRNATMNDFCGLMQSAVLDRPVVDHTELAGRWNFLLKWTPDQSQFGGMGMKVPPPSDAADAPPPLFTAIQEQIGLKLEAGKAQVPVLEIDHVEKPSGN
ncbi:MAG TPA: TIGR03435 family protein [Acidobacteriaceae bacterium]